MATTTREERLEIVSDTKAILELEGMTTTDAPEWFHSVMNDYVEGNLSIEDARKIAMDHLSKGNF